MQVKMHTSKGAITLKLFADKAPKTVENFLHYVNSGYYEGTLFHRVINGFMVQGGGLLPDMRPKPSEQPAIENEANNGLKNNTGTVAMARTSAPHSASSQFFINVNDNTFLNFSAPTTQGWGYCVFAEVVEGMDVVNDIKSMETTSRAGHSDVPAEDILIEKTEVIES